MFHGTVQATLILLFFFFVWVCDSSEIFSLAHHGKQKGTLPCVFRPSSSHQVCSGLPELQQAQPNAERRGEIVHRSIGVVLPDQVSPRGLLEALFCLCCLQDSHSVQDEKRIQQTSQEMPTGEYGLYSAEETGGGWRKCRQEK